MSSRTAGRGAFVFVFIAVLIDAVGFGIILPVLPRLIMQLTGLPIDRAAQYGGALGFVYALMQFFCAPILGNLSDQFGRRPVLLFALLALGCDYLIMGCAPVIGWLFIGRMIAGVAGASFTPAYAYVADISEPARRAQNFGLLGAAFGIGFILGPAIGGLLGGLGPRAPFFVAGALALANVSFGYFALPESLPRESRRPFRWARANPLGTLVQMRKLPAMSALLAALFLWQLGHQVFPSTWAFYGITQFHWSSREVGYSLAFVGLVMAIAQGLLTRTLIPRLGGERRAAAAGMAAAFVAYLGYAFATQGWMVYVVSLTRVPVRAHVPVDERARLAADPGQRARRTAGGGGVPVQSELYRRPAAHDPGVQLLHFPYGAGVFSRRGLPGSGGAHRCLCAPVREGGTCRAGVRRRPDCGRASGGLNVRAGAAVHLVSARYWRFAVRRRSNLRRASPSRGCRRSVTCSSSCWRTSLTPATFGAHSAAPYLATTLAREGALLKRYYAIGHASLGNYVALISGQAPNQETQLDCPDFTQFQLSSPGLDAHGQAHGVGCVYPLMVRTLPDQLEVRGLHVEGLHGGHGQRPAS